MWSDERWKVARRCGAKHISKSKCTKHLRSGPLLEIEMLKKRTPLWREAHFEVKTHQLRTTFGSWDVEKVHAVVARSTFQSQNTPAPDHFWKLRCRKSARCCGAKHILKSKVQKTDGYGAFLDVQMCFRVAGARDCAPCQKWAEREGFVTFPKAMAGVGNLKRIFKDEFRVAGAVQKICSSSEMLGGQGADFLRGVAFWSIRSFRFAEMILRDRCSTSYDLASLFRGRRSTFDRWTGKIAKRIGTKLLALHSTFHFLKEVSQNCYVFDVVKMKNWRSLAEVLRLWCCQLWKMIKSRKIASFVMLSTSNNDESRRSAASLMLSTWKKWRSLVEQQGFQACR